MEIPHDNGKERQALSESPGVEREDSLNESLARHIAAKRSMPDVEQLVQGVIKGDRAILSRAITLVESVNPSHLGMAAKVIDHCLPYSGKSIRVGITGVPGVGKSTFIEALGKTIAKSGKKVAVLAVDPSSTISHGSILGDKTRMEELVREPLAFIRPSASGSTLGGVARKTREAIILCEAAGYEVILLETVGVGQSETAVHSMTDFFLLLKITGAGDELQGIKRGIMEMADAIVINKADSGNEKLARLARVEFNRALHYFPARPDGWQPVAMTCSSLTGDGIGKVWEMILNYVDQSREAGYFTSKREHQNRYWMLETINSRLTSDFYNNPNTAALRESVTRQVESSQLSPFAAAEVLLSHHAKNKPD